MRDLDQRDSAHMVKEEKVEFYMRLTGVDQFRWLKMRGKRNVYFISDGRHLPYPSLTLLSNTRLSLRQKLAVEETRDSLLHLRAEMDFHLGGSSVSLGEKTRSRN